MSFDSVAPIDREKESGPGKNYKKSKKYVDFSFGYDLSKNSTPDPTVDLTEPKDFDENFPIARPNLDKMEDSVPQKNQDNSILGGFMNLMDNIVPDDMGGLLRGDSEQWLPDVPYVSDLYRNTVGAAMDVPLTAGEAAIDAMHWGSEQMNHLGSALVSWMPGGIQTLTWDQSHDVSFGQAFVASMGQTAGRLERGEAEAGDILMLPFSLLSLGAAQLDTDNISQNKDFDVLNEEELDAALVAVQVSTLLVVLMLLGLLQQTQRFLLAVDLCGFALELRELSLVVLLIKHCVKLNR